MMEKELSEVKFVRNHKRTKITLDLTCIDRYKSLAKIIRKEVYPDFSRRRQDLWTKIEKQTICIGDEFERFIESCAGLSFIKIHVTDREFYSEGSGGEAALKSSKECFIPISVKTSEAPGKIISKPVEELKMSNPAVQASSHPEFAHLDNFA